MVKAAFCGHNGCELFPPQFETLNDLQAKVYKHRAASYLPQMPQAVNGILATSGD